MNILSTWSICACAFVFVQSASAIDETRFVREGVNETLLFITSTTILTGSWKYCSNCDRGNINVTPAPVYVALDSDTVRERVAVVYDPDNGVYNLTLLKFHGETDAGVYFCEVLLEGLQIETYFYSVQLADGPSTASITGTVPVFADGYSSLILTCNTNTATPGVTYEWRNGAMVIPGETDNTLTLSPVQPLHDGAEITCTAINSVFDDIRVTSQSAILTVYYGPERATITGTIAVYADGNNRLTLTCTAYTVSPAVTFDWSTPGVTGGKSVTSTGTTSTLTITPVWSDNGQTVECIAKNSQYPDRQTTDTVTLTIHYGPTSVTITGNVPVYPDSPHNVTLICTADQYNPDVAYQWIAGKTIVAENTNTYRNIVNQTDDGRIITCRTWNSQYPDRQRETTVSLTVYYGIYNTEMGVLPAQISEGEDVVVKCTSNGNPSPTFTFFKDLEVLVHNSLSDILEISNISRSDAGLYQCRAENHYKFETVEIAINVRYAPDITMTIPTNLRTNDEDISIYCTASGNPTEYTFGQWVQLDANNHTPIRFLDGIQNGSIFQLTFQKPLSHQDSGNYKCSVHNGVIGTNGHLYQTQVKTLAVKGKPYIYEETGIFFGDIGQPSYIQVYFNSYPVYSHLTWFVFDGDGQEITAVELNGGFESSIRMETLVTKIYDVTVNVSAYVAILLIKNVTEHDFKKYHVIIVNEMGQSQKTVELAELVKPENNCACPESDSVVGVVLGSVSGTLLIVLIVHVVMWKRRILKLSCSDDKKKEDPDHIYQNRSFDTVEDISADSGENAYQPVGPEENPNLHYQTLESVTTR